jgi:hypothetical protein
MNGDGSTPLRCHCERGWFNPDVYGECAQCRAALVAAIRAVRRVFPGSHIVGAPGLPWRGAYVNEQFTKVGTG